MIWNWGSWPIGKPLGVTCKPPRWRWINVNCFRHLRHDFRIFKVSGQSGNFSDSLKSFRTVWKVYWQYGKFLDSLESFQTVWKVSKQSGKLPDILESFQIINKLFGQCENFPDSLQSFRTVWKVSEQSGKFPDSLVSFPWHVCHVCESNLRMHGTFMSQKLFTHFWRIFVAKTIYAPRPESFCAWNSADRKVLTFCVSAGGASQRCNLAEVDNKRYLVRFLNRGSRQSWIQKSMVSIYKALYISFGLEVEFWLQSFDTQ